MASVVSGLPVLRLGPIMPVRVPGGLMFMGIDVIPLPGMPYWGGFIPKPGLGGGIGFHGKLPMFGFPRLGPIIPVPIDGPVMEGPVIEGPVMEGPVMVGPVIDGPVMDGPVMEGPLIMGPPIMGPLIPGPGMPPMVGGCP